RVKAQEAIERVYYSHQIGATKPFEQAVPRSLLEKKVRLYLSESVALDRVWHTKVTEESLRREAERIARDTRMPNRIRELYASLDNDPVLILECLARPTLVERLTRNFFAYDEAIHASSRRTVEALHHDLLKLDSHSRGEDSRATVTDVLLDDAEHTQHLVGLREPAGPGLLEPIRKDASMRLRLPREEFDRWVTALPLPAGEVGSIEEVSDGYRIQTVLARDGHRPQYATYQVAK